MTITGQSSLGKDDIDRMVRDAEAHAEDDRRRREEAEVRNKADTLVYQTEKMLKDQGDVVRGRREGEGRVGPGSLKEALAGSDIEAIKTADRDAADGQPGASASGSTKQASQGRRPARRRRRSAGRRRRRDDEVVDAEIVDDEELSVGDRHATSQRDHREREGPDAEARHRRPTRPAGPDRDGATSVRTTPPHGEPEGGESRRGGRRRDRSTPPRSTRRWPRPFADDDPMAAGPQQRDEYLDALRRLQADFENYKKRMIKQQTDQWTGRAAALVEQAAARPRHRSTWPSAHWRDGERRKASALAGSRPAARRAGQGGPGADRPAGEDVRPHHPRRGGACRPPRRGPSAGDTGPMPGRAGGGRGACGPGTAGRARSSARPW